MAVLSDKDILSALKSKTLLIEPFYEDGLQPASYDARLYWKLLVSPSRHDRGREIDLRQEPDQQLSVQPGRFVGALTEEVLTMPLTLSGRFGLRSEFTRRGLVAFGGIQIDPEFHGRLIVSLFNAGPEPIVLRLGHRMFTVEFSRLESAATKGYGDYGGAYQDQDDFSPDERAFILNAHTVSLSEIVSLPDELARERQWRVTHEVTMHARHPSATLRELAEAQGLTPIDAPAGLAGGWPEDEDFDRFLEAIQLEK